MKSTLDKTNHITEYKKSLVTYSITRLKFLLPRQGSDLESPDTESWGPFVFALY